LDCGETDRPEEFPLWTDWWLAKPTRGEESVRLFAILDSVSCVGAYEFFITPGRTTISEIQATLFFRDPTLIQQVDPQHKALDTIGMAPLTSMFWFGENSERKFDDYRPEVHDSDGLLMHLDGEEMLWRPLDNGTAMRHQKFSAKHLQGFGLLQRDRNFSDYQDMFNSYQSTPSVWVQPMMDQSSSNWDDGEIHLVELSTGYEGLDNIVAFWAPKNKPPPGQPFSFGYTLYWTREQDIALSTNEVVSTRIGRDAANDKWHDFVIDYDLPKVTSDDAAPKPVASCSTNAAIVDLQIFRNHAAKTWRVILKLQPKDNNKDPVDLRCTLKFGEEATSETWTYLWSPL
jgi:glucans biosynthesis protein